MKETKENAKEKRKNHGRIRTSPAYNSGFPFVAKMEFVGEKKKYCVGVDEAGRGPVLGPMVYGACICPLERHNTLFDDGYRDSKQLTAAARELLFDRIEADNDLDYVLQVLSPELLSEQMLAKSKISLNVISHNSCVCLVREALARGYNVTDVYVDTVGPPEKYEEWLNDQLPGVECHVSKKADSKWAAVSAASICAKVTRDKLLRDWKFKENLSLAPSLDLGSGYPGDPSTKQWLVDNIHPVFGWPSLVRFGWRTAYEKLENEGVPVVWGSEVEANNNELIAKGKMEPKTIPKERRLAHSRYFAQSPLHSVDYF